MFRRQSANLITLLLSSIQKFFNIFRFKQPISQKYKNDISSLLNKFDKESDLQQKEDFIFQAILLFQNAKEQEQLLNEDILAHLQGMFDVLESKIDEFQGWKEDSLYQMKFRLILIAFYDYKSQVKVKRYIRELTSDYFIDNIFRQFTANEQIIFTICFSTLLHSKNDSQNAIRICEKFLKDLVVENQISFHQYQKVYVNLIYLYESQNMHMQSFNLIEEIIRLISTKQYAQDFSHIPQEQATKPLLEMLSLIDYCQKYDQYELAYKLGETILQLDDLKKYQYLYKLPEEINLLKNLDKHIKILLDINKQIQNLERNIDHEMENNFIYSLNQFLSYQFQYNQSKENQYQSQNLPIIIEKNLVKFSCDTKDQILTLISQFEIQ